MDLLKNYLALLIFGEKNNEQCKVISAIADNHSWGPNYYVCSHFDELGMRDVQLS